MQGSEGKSINLFIFMYVQTKTTYGSNTKSMLAHILHAIIQYMRPIDFHFFFFFFLKYGKSKNHLNAFSQLPREETFEKKSQKTNNT